MKNRRSKIILLALLIFGLLANSLSLAVLSAEMADDQTTETVEPEPTSVELPPEDLLLTEPSVEESQSLELTDEVLPTTELPDEVQPTSVEETTDSDVDTELQITAEPDPTTEVATDPLEVTTEPTPIKNAPSTPVAAESTEPLKPRGGETVTVTLVLGGGTAEPPLYPVMYIPKGEHIPRFWETITHPGTLVHRPGYILTHWLRDGEEYGNQVIYEDTTLVAVWAEAVTVTYNPNGGTLMGGELSFLQKKGEPLIYEPWLAKTGYIQDGWLLNGSRYNNQPLTQNVSLVAIWAQAITVTCDLTGGTYDGQSTYVFEIKKGTSALDRLPPATRPGYPLAGWLLNDTLYAGQLLYQNTTLKAYWGETVTLTYKANGGTINGGSTYNLELPKGQLAPILLPERTNYYFDGWYIGPDYYQQTPIIEDTILTAAWTLKPPPVYHLKAVATDMTIRLSWNQDDPQTEGYIIYRQAPGETNMTYRYMVTGKAFNDAVTQEGFHFYRVYAYRTYNGVRYISYSHSYVYAKAQMPAPPAPVTNLKAQSNGMNITLSWTASPGADGYMIYRQAPGESSMAYRMLVTSTSFRDAVTQEGFHYYRVFPYRTVNGIRNFGQSTRYVYAKSQVVAPPPISNLRAVTSGKTIALSWKTSEPVDGYIVYRMGPGETTFKYRYMVTRLGFNDTVSQAGTYFYRVYPYRVNTSGERLVGTSNRYVYGIVK